MCLNNVQREQLAQFHKLARNDRAHHLRRDGRETLQHHKRLLQVGLVEKMARGEKKPCRDAESEGATDDTGGEKVGTKKGTTKFGLPCNWLTNPMLVTEIGGKPRSEAARSKA